MINKLYKLLGYVNNDSLGNNNSERIHKYSDKTAAIIIESCYITYLKRKMLKERRKKKRQLYRRIKRTNPKFLKNISDIKQNKYVN